MKVGLTLQPRVPSEWVDPGRSSSTSSKLQGYNVARQCRAQLSPLYQDVSGTTIMLGLATTAVPQQESKLIHEKLLQ